MHNVKQKRLQRSQEKNPLFQDKLAKRKLKRKEKKLTKMQNDKIVVPESDNKDEVKPSAKSLKAKARRDRKKNKGKPDVSGVTENGNEKSMESFTGIVAEAGAGLRSRTNWKL